MNVLVTHALSQKPELFTGVYPCLDRGVLLLSATPAGDRVVRAFNAEVWAAFEVID